MHSAQTQTWAERHGLSPGHELYEAEIKELMAQKEAAAQMPTRRRGGKEPAHGAGCQAGHVSDAAAEEQMDATGGSLEICMFAFMSRQDFVPTLVCSFLQYCD